MQEKIGAAIAVAVAVAMITQLIEQQKAESPQYLNITPRRGTYNLVHTGSTEAVQRGSREPLGGSLDTERINPSGTVPRSDRTLQKCKPVWNHEHQFREVAYRIMVELTTLSTAALGSHKVAT